LRRYSLIGFAAAVLALAGLASTATAANSIRLVEAGQSHFPFRSYVLTLPKAQPLPLSSLQVTENGTLVRNLSVVSAQAAKESQFGVVLAIDASQSMRGKPIAAAMAAARAFAAHRNPNQQLGVITFNGSVKVLQPLTTQSGAIKRALSHAPRLSYGTHMYDALDEAGTMLAAAHVQGASVVLLSDGADVGSRAKPAAVLAALKQQHVRGFTIGLASKTFDRSSLQQVATRTGATFTEAPNVAALRPIYDALGYQLSREYILSYQSLAGPGARIHVRAQVAGVPGVGTTEYVTPSLELKPAPPYHPSLSGRILQSWVTMVIVSLLAAAAVGWAIVEVARPREGTLIERVGNFVSIRRHSAQDADLGTRRRVDLLGGAEGAFERLRWWPRFKATLELADIDASPTQILGLALLGTALLAMLLFLWIGALGFIIGIVVGPLVTRWAIRTKLARKRRAFAEQLPDNLEVIAAALRAGHSLVGALSAVVESSSEPSHSEFRRVVAQEQLGVPLEDALNIVVERMDSRDLDQVALVARLQRETGSAASEVIDRVIETVRSRQEIRRLVRTLTTQGRLSRWILTAIPVLLALVIPLINHGYMDPLFHRTSGQILLVLTGIMVVSGSVAIGKIVDIKV
jgi:tight adherence protein B